MTCQALQHETIEIFTIEPRRQRLTSCVGEVGTIPLLPGLQRSPERGSGFRVLRTLSHILMRERDACAGSRWIGVESQFWQGREAGLCDDPCSEGTGG